MSLTARFIVGLYSLALTGASENGVARPVPEQMIAVQGSGAWFSCNKPNWSCISEKTVAVPRPLQGQVLIEMHGTSVNPLNVDMVEPGCEFISFAGGCSKGTLGDVKANVAGDAAGVVVAVGADCSDFKVGDEVWSLSAHGSYAQYATANCTQIGLKPRVLSFVDAGTIPSVGGTSLQCLKAAGMPSQKSNLTVVVTGAQGGTGFVGVQLAKALGATRVITAATGPGIDLAKSLGADVVIDYHKQDLSDALPDDSVDIVFDNIGVMGTADKIMHAIRSGGTYLVVMGGGRGTISSHPKAGVRQVPFHLVTAARKELDELKELFEAKKLRPHTMQPTYGLSEVAEAFTRLRSHGVLGKIAVVPGQKDQPASTPLLV